jgi:N-acetylmuramoyl-L-alanine amidase
MKVDRSKKFSEFFEKKIEPRKIDFLVLHHIEANSAEHAIEQLCEHQVSSHYLIDEDGKIFELVDENDVAYHAGVSYWRGIDALNQTSIGIEFINSSPFEKKFEPAQMQAGLELCQHLITKYKIPAQNIAGHSDIAYNKETGLPDRKQDPSHLFDWQFLRLNGVGIFPDFSLDILTHFKPGEHDEKIAKAKINLIKFGYRVMNLNDEFDQELQALVTVFNRRFFSGSVR